MQERSACLFLGIVFIVTIVFFTIAIDETNQSTIAAQQSNGPTVMINGQSFEPSFSDKTGRIIVVVDQDDLFVGENTLEIHWGSEPSTTMTAELPTITQQH